MMHKTERDQGHVQHCRVSLLRKDLGKVEMYSVLSSSAQHCRLETERIFNNGIVQS